MEQGRIWREGIVARLADATAFEDIAAVFRHVCIDRGVPRASYHHLPPVGADDGTFQIHAEGFPEDWVDHYVNDRLFRHDPITRLALQRAEPFLWSEIESLARLGRAERAFLLERRAAGVGDGLSVPVFGPGGRNGYFGIGLPEGAGHPPRSEVRDLQWLCQLAHHRFCDILAGTKPPSEPLSAREEEVLRWMAEGKSNADIATILGISAHTVDTFARRLFAKLGVADRVTAVLRGIERGAVSVYLF